MSLFAIGDTHLSFGTDKPMNVFRGWDNYVERLESNWKRVVKQDDTVVIMGDVSWSMNLDGAYEDFRFLDSLPGEKIILKGNHDYWWNTKKKTDEFFKNNSFDTLNILFNNSYRVGDISVCGTRGWFFDAENDADLKIVNREAGRLRASIAEGKKLGGEPVVFLHYPPINSERKCEPILNVLIEEGITHCYYAHLHSASAAFSFNGTAYGIKFELMSADWLGFCPKAVQLIK